jgi:hypothetical protein
MGVVINRHRRPAEEGYGNYPSYPSRPPSPPSPREVPSREQPIDVGRP